MPAVEWAGGARHPRRGRLEYDFTTLSVIRGNRTLGATWTMIGRAEGKSPKIAKRDAKRLTARTRRTWYLQHNQQDAP